MAVGTISSPVTWLLRQVVTPTWLQNIQDTLNNTYAYKSKTRYLWIGPEMMRSPSGQWVFSVNIAAGPIWTATANSDYLICPIPLFYTTSGSQYQKLTSVSVKMKPNGGGAVNCAVTTLTGMDGTSVQGFTSPGNANSSGSSLQTVTVGSLTASCSDSTHLNMTIAAGNAGDVVYGVRLTYENSTIVSP